MTCTLRDLRRTVSASGKSLAKQPLIYFEVTFLRDKDMLCLAFLINFNNNRTLFGRMYYFFHKGSLKQSDSTGCFGQMACRLVCLGD